MKYPLREENFEKCHNVKESEKKKKLLLVLLKI